MVAQTVHILRTSIRYIGPGGGGGSIAVVGKLSKVGMHEKGPREGKGTF